MLNRLRQMPQAIQHKPLYYNQLTTSLSKPKDQSFDTYDFLCTFVSCNMK